MKQTNKQSICVSFRASWRMVQSLTAVWHETSHLFSTLALARLSRDGTRDCWGTIHRSVNQSVNHSVNQLIISVSSYVQTKMCGSCDTQITHDAQIHRQVHPFIDWSISQSVTQLINQIIINVSSYVQTKVCGSCDTQITHDAQTHTSIHRLINQSVNQSVNHQCVKLCPN